MKILLLFTTIGLGFLVTFHISMNAYVGVMTRNANLANMIFWIIGACVAVMLGVTNWDAAFVDQIGSVPKWLFLAGAIGACLAFFTNLMIPTIGLYNLTILIILGQLVTSMAFSHFGILTQNADPINPAKILGSGLVLLGSILVVYGKIPFLEK